MPQLDKVTFFSQFFWTFIIFLAFYLYIYKYFLPKISRILLFREKRISQSQQGVTTLGEERSKIRQGVEMVMDRTLQASKGLFSDTLSKTSQWCDSVLKDTHRTKWKETNRSYVSSIGENSLSQNLSLLTFFPLLPKKILLSSLCAKLKTGN
jgi:hypothetical protein|uniref:H(+)-transporting two-sector ATPase n=1 Tax=Botryococcus braunii Showa TaxID=1202541 RepID=A0A167RLB6_BOTBR|nr:ATP synthase F0 subunit 8 [Botryococcus braunii Showa]